VTGSGQPIPNRRMLQSHRVIDAMRRHRTYFVPGIPRTGV
jgi:hypothetical protein